MFRVPSSADAPSFDQTFKVGFMRWLTSSAADRHEWRIRMDIANRLRHDQATTARTEKYAATNAELRARSAQIRAEIMAQLRGRRR